MALIFVPALAAVGFMLMSNLGTAAGTVATLAFAALAMGVFGGLLKLTRTWETEA